MQEIARRKNNKNYNPDDISGLYTNAWIEFLVEKKAVCTDLKILRLKDGLTYSLEWQGTGIKGKGMKLGAKQFVAVYWKTNEEPYCLSKI